MRNYYNTLLDFNVKISDQARQLVEKVESNERNINVVDGYKIIDQYLRHFITIYLSSDLDPFDEVSFYYECLYKLKIENDKEKKNKKFVEHTVTHWTEDNIPYVKKPKAKDVIKRKKFGITKKRYDKIQKQCKEIRDLCDQLYCTTKVSKRKELPTLPPLPDTDDKYLPMDFTKKVRNIHTIHETRLRNIKNALKKDG